MPETETPEAAYSNTEGGFKKGKGFVPSETLETSKNAESALKVKLRRFLSPYAVSSGAVLSSILMGACSEGDGGGTKVSVVPERPSATVKIEFTPGATTASGETIVPGTNVAIGKGGEIGTATPVATETPKPTEVPKTPEKPASKWQVEVSEEIKGKTLPHSDHTVEESRVIVQSVVDKFPQIGNLKIILTGGNQTDELRLGEQEIRIGVDVTGKELVQWSVAHEIMHFLDPALNGGALSQYLTPSELSTLTALREQILTSPVWGREYPSLDKIFNTAGNKISKSSLGQRDFSRAEVVGMTNRYPEALWVTNWLPSADKREAVFLEGYMPKLQEAITSHSNDTSNGLYGSVADFMARNKAEIDNIAAQDPMAAKAIELITKQQDYFTIRNLLWTFWSTDSNKGQAGFSFRTVKDGWQALGNIAEVSLEDAYLNGDRSVAALLDPIGKIRVSGRLAEKKLEADGEAFAEKGAAQIGFGDKAFMDGTPMATFFSSLAEIAKSK